MKDPQEHPEFESPGRREELVTLLMQHQTELFQYVFRFIPNRSDAEDVFQETLAVICRKFDDYEAGTNFRAWAYKIAFWQVRSAKQKFARSKLLFSEEALEAIAAQSDEERGEEQLRRQEALSNCVGKLQERDRAMVLARYEEDGGVDQAATRSGRSVVATYKALARVRKMLRACMLQQLGGAA